MNTERNKIRMRMRLLAPGLTPVAVERHDARTLALRPMGGYLMWPVERLVRNLRNPITIGLLPELGIFGEGPGYCAPTLQVYE